MAVSLQENISAIVPAPKKINSNRKSNLRYLMIPLLSFAFAACSPEGQMRLADDPDNEPLAQPSTEEGTSELPSLGDTVALPPGGGSAPDSAPVAAPETEIEKILALYDYVDPTQIVPTKALEQALVYYHQNKSTLKVTNVLSIIDFSQSSRNKRWYFVDMVSGSVWNIHVSHGKGSDANHDGLAEKFSNVSGSNATSVGFYKTAETYYGKHDYSLRLDGLSSTNSKARSRAIVVHGANYVQDSNVIQGRSWGCPAVSMANRTKVINLIKGGSLILAVK